MKLFEKITNRLHERAASNRLVELTKVIADFKNTDTTRYMEPGKKTAARFCMFETVRCALIHVYGYDAYCYKLHIHGINIEENIVDEAYREGVIRVNISTDRPGFVIGKHGSDIELLEDVLSSTFGKTTIVNIKEWKSRFVGVDWIDLY